MTVEVELAVDAPSNEPFVTKKADEIRQHLKSMIGVTCSVVVKRSGTVPRSQGKAVRVKDLRETTN